VVPSSVPKSNCLDSCDVDPSEQSRNLTSSLMVENLWSEEE
jgi:hypothetical protein